MAGKYNPQDRYFKKAKDAGFRARSVFKLEEIQNRFKLIRFGDKVLDLGAAPGSFMQFIGRIAGEDGVAVGLDLKRIESFKQKNLIVFEGDIFDEAVYERILAETGVFQFDVITSDLAPATTGIKSVDAGRSFELNQQALYVAGKYLKKGGNVLVKAFPGADHSELIREMKDMFKIVKMFKPQAVRQTSREEYLIGLKLKCGFDEVPK